MWTWLASTAWTLPSSPCRIPAASTWPSWSACQPKLRHVMVVPNLGGITNSAVAAKDLRNLAVEIKYNLLDPWALGPSGRWTS